MASACRFSRSGGHVVGDIPEHWKEAGFDGPILHRSDQHSDVPA